MIESRTITFDQLMYQIENDYQDFYNAAPPWTSNYDRRKYLQMRLQVWLHIGEKLGFWRYEVVPDEVLRHLINNSSDYYKDWGLQYESHWKEFSDAIQNMRYPDEEAMNADAGLRL